MPNDLGEIEELPPPDARSRRSKPFFQEPSRSKLAKIRRRFHRRRQASARTMLPLLIKVFAGFSKLDGKIVEDDIDSSLGFLRHDYPEALYSELKDLYQKALNEPQDLNETAQELANQLDIEEKILLGVQLYVLISRAQFQRQQLLSFYLFMTNLGVASEAIDIVYQLNTSEFGKTTPEPESSQPLESLAISGTAPADVVFDTLPVGCAVAAFRFQNLVLVKNVGNQTIIARGRQVEPGEFCRLFEGQRILLVDVVLDYQDLMFYFNAKKNVSSTKLYLAFSSAGTPYIEKTQSRDSYLEIRFGLNIAIRALRDTDAQVNRLALRRGAEVEVSLSDRITFRDKTEVSLSELRQRARELGGSFDLTTSRTEYRVSNDPAQLRQGDILLSPGTAGRVVLIIRCNYETKSGELEVIESDRPLMVRDLPVRDRALLDDGEIIKIGAGQFLRCDFSERIIEEVRNIISRLEIRDLSHQYDGRTTALDAVSMSAQRGEMICVMGPSGCGKSTLLRCLAGHLKPKQGEVHLNGLSLYENTESLKPFISFIPHEDAFDPLLTVKENITTAAAVRSPHLSYSDRNQRVSSKLTELGLYQIRGRVAGTAEDKNLSGGERKRLNVGLDMVAISDVYLIDEPTSGLSSKDSEHVIDVIRGMAHNKIVLVSIHQPSARLFRMFNKALLLDKGGKLAFFGTPDEVLAYFHEAYDEEVGRGFTTPDPALAQGANNQAPWNQPDFIFDVLETPLRDLSGDIIYEQDARGHYSPARRFSPDFWRDRFQAHRIVIEARQASAAAGRPRDRDATDLADVIPAEHEVPKRPVRRGREEAVQFAALLKRAFLSKLRNRANLFTTLLEAPTLAVLVATVLRYSEDGTYTFAAAFHIPTYLFLSLVIAMFLGLTNSADEIIRDRALLQRERNQDVRIVYYILSKLAALSLFALIQCVIYILIGNSILGVRGMFWIYLGWMFLTAVNGIAIGLLISSFVRDSKTAINWIPLVLIPQIILGGALIKYEEMNRNLDFVFSIRKWTEAAEPGNGFSDPSHLKVPVICEFMPLRWAYEALVIAQANHNPISGTVKVLEDRIRELRTIIDTRDLRPDELEDLDLAKNGLAVVASLEGETPAEVASMLESARKQLRHGTFDPADFSLSSADEPITAEEIYVNKKVLDLVTKAEMERLDYRRDTAPPNVFFGIEKNVFGLHIDTLKLNLSMLFLFCLAALLILYLCVHHTLNKVT